jgi:hypothetical protein
MSRAGDFGASSVQILILKALRIDTAFPTAHDLSDRNYRLLPPNLLPCKAWHGNWDMRLTFGGGMDHSLQLTGFADADWANDSDTRKSRSGYLFTLGRGPISYKSKQETCVAQSTC